MPVLRYPGAPRRPGGRDLPGTDGTGLTGPVLMVGLTGGIGSGKSAVAARLAELGAVIVDSDRIAREVVEPGTDGLREIVEVFGERVLRADGSLDRPALGAVVFGDDAARARLEGITHPRVRARSAQLVAAAPVDAIVVNDVPLLVEVGLAPTYHLVLVVQTARDLRVERLIRDRGMTAGQANQRIEAQTGDAERRAAADVLLGNDGDLGALHAQVDVLWRDRLVPYEHNLRERRPVRPDRAGGAGPDQDLPARFVRIAARIRHAVGPVVRIDQLDSTELSDPASDAVAVRLGVGSLVEADALAEPLTVAGFPRCAADRCAPSRHPDGTERPDERLHGSADPGCPVELRVQVTGSPG